MSLPLIRVSSGLFCCLLLGAQAPTSSAPSISYGTITGIVIDRGSGAPIRRAVVTLSTVESQPQDAVAWTDANGRFSFSYLSAGRYELHVIKNGYQPAAYGSETPRRPPAIIQLAAGEIRNDLIFRLQLITSVSGLVLDEDGDPLAGVQIMAMRLGWQRRKRRFLPGPAANSDGNGRYRLSGLAAGRYAFVASCWNRPDRKTRPEATAGESQPRYGYGLQYYPGTDRAASATLIPVETGQEYSQIDFRLAAQPIASLQGKIVLPAGVISLDQVSIAASSDDLANRMNMGTGVSQPDYNFRFDQFLAGSYTLLAQATAEGKRYRGVQRIEVGPDGAHDLAIALEPAIDLSGSVSVEGPDAAKYSASFVSLSPGDGIPSNGPPLHANVGKDGRFTITNVPPGIWDINAGPIPPGGYIKSMYLGDQDVLTEEMAIGPSTSAPLKIVLGTQAATVAGDVTSGDKPARAAVLLAPDGKFHHVLSFYGYAPTDDKGHFEIKGVTPGNYKLYAFEEFDPQSIQDPEFLPPFEQAGAPVTLREGAKTTKNLNVMSSSNDVRSGGTR
jgi:Carboxypeptidase regulatory-like domain